MNINALDQLLEQLKVQAHVFHNGHYCGNWAVDTSGNGQINFHVVSHGRCFLRIGSTEFTLSQGDAVFFPKDAKHTLASISQSGYLEDQHNQTPHTQVETNKQEAANMDQPLPNDATGLVCGSLSNNHPLFRQLIAPLPNYILVRATNSTPCSAITNLLLDESIQTNSHSSLMLNRLSDCLFHYLLRNNLEADQGVFAASTHPKLSKAMEEIHNNMEYKHTVDSLAAAAGMSRSSFASEFKKATHISPMDYVTQWRMLCAYRWLADDQISTLEAAGRCGYENESSFSKAFSRILGLGPGQVRSGSQPNAG